jgi:nitrogen fixation protein NifB
VEDSVFGNLGEPSKESVIQVRKDAQDFLPVMKHCSRCRADAVGLLSEKLDNAGISLLQSFAGLALNPQETRPFVAVASREGMLVNLHLGEAEKLYVYTQKGDEYLLVDVRKAPFPGGGNRRWEDLAKLLSDCQAILVAKVGRFPGELLYKAGIKVFEMQGLIEEGLELVFNGQEVPSALKPPPCTSCAHTEPGGNCRCSGGSGMGCG